jgi:putative ABC transport system permease protein
MNLKHSDIVLKSIRYYRKPLFYQFIIIVLLAAVISGSILTGFSVRQSLKKSAETKLGKTDILVSSGLRFFKSDLSERLSAKSGLRCIPLLETTGYCLNLKKGNKALNINIYGITSGFFEFNVNNHDKLNSGEAVINSALAKKLNLAPGDEISISFRQLSDVPANSPFAPETENGSLVVKVVRVITQNQGGNFNLGINQITPENVFVSLEDLAGSPQTGSKTNRILINTGKQATDLVLINSQLQEVLQPEDIGLRTRNVPGTSEKEIISSRIFIDPFICDQIKYVLPESKPVITYLANSFTHDEHSTPYSFISAVDEKMLSSKLTGNDIIINKWLADDLKASVNDSITVTWYAPGKISDLEETNEKFRISEIVSQNGLFADSTLMPLFPGISGKESCTSWDAGVKLNMSRIRKKDETYWEEFRGTPKAFISYIKGKAIWGNNFGPSTAIRIEGISDNQQLTAALKGRLEPEKSGFTIRNIKSDMIKAADESVDFTSLFISLGFFLIFACFILLILNVNSFLSSREKQVSTLFAIGFRNSWIIRTLIIESGLLALSGSILGAICGIPINWIIIRALNTVWIGAVQTDALIAYSNLNSILTGFISTFIVMILFFYLRLRKYIINLAGVKHGSRKFASVKKNSWALAISALVSILMIAALLVNMSKSYSFPAGIIVFITLMLFWRQYILRESNLFSSGIADHGRIANRYFRYHPSSALAPILFISAGLFAVMITGINRLEINNKSLGASGGTGGYLLWAETSLQVKEDLNSITGRKAFGFDDGTGSELKFLQGRQTSGDDASCLNLNHISSPPLLGIDSEQLTKKGAFSFSSLMKGANRNQPWSVLSEGPGNTSIYGVADQTVLEWGLRISVGDTLKVKTESGEILNVIIAGALESSIFQGYIIVDKQNIEKFFPSISGNNIFLIDGNPSNLEKYAELLNNRLENFGIDITPASERLSSFFKVTNTYLSVFTILGGLGLILGIAGLGFVLKRNYYQRKREFALLMATGYKDNIIRKIVIREQLFILFAGIITGIVSPVIATLPSIKNGSDIPWLSLALICALMTLVGLITISNSVRQISQRSLIGSLRKE